MELDLRPYFAFLRPFFVALDNVWLANAIKDSRWWFPVIETAHVLGFSILMGSTFLVDMHFFGISMNRFPMQRVARALWPWTIGGLIITAFTGVLMVVGEAIKCLENQAFWPKMILFLAAVIFQMTLHKRLSIQADDAPAGALGKVSGLVSVFLWTSIFLAGRAIGFV
jgi:hypothetical protein